MNPVHQHPTPTLHIVPRVAKVTLPIRRLEAQQGIIWAMIPEVFARYHWDVQEHTELFIKAYHEKTNQTVLVSKMGQGTVLINHDYHTYSVSDLHEIESLADTNPVQPEKTPKKKHSVRGVWITLMVMMRLLV